MAFFTRGFLEYFESGQFSDTTLVVEGREYRVHRIIMVYSSGYFAEKLAMDAHSYLNHQPHQNHSHQQQQHQQHHPRHEDGNGSPKCSQTFVLEVTDPNKLIPVILRYMYAGNIAITDENSVPLLSLANFLVIEDLKKRVANYLSSRITRKNALFVLQKALEFSTEEVISKCILVIARNYSTLATSEESPFNFLPLPIMMTLLKHGSLAVMSEYVVYQTVCEYIRYKGDELNPSDREALFANVRLPYLTYQQLGEVLRSSLVPQSLLTEALMVKLGHYECPDAPLPVKKRNKTYLQRRPTCGRLFEYTHDFDDKGVLYWIATQGGESEWCNPASLPPPIGIKVSSSSIERGNPSDIVELKTTECWTKDVPSSWFAIDLGKNRTLVLTYYTLRHGGNSRQDCLRNWVVQCSDDTVEWETIKRHVNEPILNSNFATHSWPVTCMRPHRYFRILQTGHNSSNVNFFSLSGIEFYGDLYEKHE